MYLKNSELIKMIKIFGPKRILNMYANRKINISAKQRDEVIDIKNEKKEIKYNTIVKKD